VSLDRSRLQKIRELEGGSLQAQCPACAESGQDRKGEHLRISRDGKFGCCVHAGDREHRKRIFALAGENQRLLPPELKMIRLKVAAPAETASKQLNLLGRLGRVLGKSDCRMENAEPESTGPEREIGTAGTLVQKSYAYRAKSESDHYYIRKLIGCDEPVPSVPILNQENGAHRSDRPTLPYLLSDGTLVIPFNSPERYHWWKAGALSVGQTIAEIRQRKENDASPF
jgi:hypothetical protein